MSYQIHVTAIDLGQGFGGDRYTCALARAAQRATGDSEARLTPGETKTSELF